MELDIGVTSHSINRSISSGKPMYGLYTFSRTPIEGANVDSLMTAS